MNEKARILTDEETIQEWEHVKTCIKSMADENARLKQEIEELKNPQTKQHNIFNELAAQAK